MLTAAAGEEAKQAFANLAGNGITNAVYSDTTNVIQYSEGLLMPARIYLPTPRKYRNQPQVVDGLKFASKREAGRYLELKMMQIAGLIKNLVADKKLLRWDLSTNGMKICAYEADFAYEEWLGGMLAGYVVEDAKGYKTPAYRIKKKLMLACHGIEIRET